MLPRIVVVGIALLLPGASAAQTVGLTSSPFHHLHAQKPGPMVAKELDQVGRPRLFQREGVAGIAFSPDGRWIATGDRGANNQVYLWDRRTGEAKWILKGHVSWIARLAFSADSEFLLVSHDDDPMYRSFPGEMVVWKVATGEMVKYHQPVDWSIRKDGKSLAVGRANPFDAGPGDLALRFKGFTVDIVDFPSHKLRRSITHPDKGIQSLALSPDGAFLAVGASKEILLWDATTGKALPGISDLKERVHQLKFSPNGETLASISDNFLADVERSVDLWEVKTGKKLGVLKVEKGRQFRHMEFLSDNTLLTQRFLGEYRFWDLAKRETIRTMQVGVLAVFENGKGIAHNRDEKWGNSPRVFFEEYATGKPWE